MNATDLRVRDSRAQGTIGVRPSRATGPRTEGGKARSALNALKHGLGAIQALLPGEDVDLYEARANAFFAAHGVDNGAVAEVASLAFDDVWRLERLGKVENALLISRIEELRCQTELAEKAAATTQAILTLGAALDEWVEEPVPARRCDELSRRISATRNALNTVTELLPDLDLEPFAAADRVLTRAIDKVGNVALPVGLHDQVRVTCLDSSDHGKLENGLSTVVGF